MDLVNQHPSNFQLEALSVNDLAVSERDVVKRHCQECSSCQAYMDELAVEQSTLMALKPAPAFVHEVKERLTNAGPPASSDWWQGLWQSPLFTPLAGAVGALALILVVGAVFLLPSRQGPDTLRTMGGLQVQGYLRHDNKVSILAEPSTISSGDALQYKLYFPSAGYLTVFFLDEGGQLSWLLPPTASGQAQRVSKGHYQLPTSAVFDDSRITERSFVLFSPEHFIPSQIAATIKQAWMASDGVTFTDDRWLPPMSGMQSSVFKKQQTR